MMLANYHHHYHHLLLQLLQLLLELLLLPLPLTIKLTTTTSTYNSTKHSTTFSLKRDDKHHNYHHTHLLPHNTTTTTTDYTINKIHTTTINRTTHLFLCGVTCPNKKVRSKGDNNGHRQQTQIQKLRSRAHGEDRAVWNEDDCSYEK
jgi:hypothetical protein